MPPTPLMKEDYILQIPALQLLQSLGWEYLAMADVEIDLLRRWMNWLKEQKKGLMQKPLTGEVRVGCLGNGAQND